MGEEIRPFNVALLVGIKCSKLPSVLLFLSLGTGLPGCLLAHQLLVA